MIRAAIEAHTGSKAPTLPPETLTAGLGVAPLELCSTLLSAAEHLGPPGGIPVPAPEPMENFMQGYVGLELHVKALALPYTALHYTCHVVPWDCLVCFKQTVPSVCDPDLQDHRAAQP